MIYGPKTECVVNNHQWKDGKEVGKGDRKTNQNKIKEVKIKYLGKQETPIMILLSYMNFISQQSGS